MTDEQTLTCESCGGTFPAHLARLNSTIVNCPTCLEEFYSQSDLAYLDDEEESK